MKKLWLLLFLFIPLRLHAAIQDALVNQEKTYVVHYTTTVSPGGGNGGGTTGLNVNRFLLVSLSTTSTLFPHTINNPNDIGEIDISHLTSIMDKVATATTTIKIGVVNFISASTGSVTYFWERSSIKNVSNTDVIQTPNFTPAFYRARVRPGVATSTGSAAVDGQTPFILSSSKDSGSWVWNSTGTYQSPLGSGATTCSLHTGDVVMTIQTDATNTVNFTIDVWYHAEP